MTSDVRNPAARASSLIFNRTHGGCDERIEIEGSPGYWMGGVAISDDAGNPICWDRDVIVLEWQSGDVLYRFHAEGVELATLLAAAESLEWVGP